MAYFNWSDKYSVNVSAMDAQHKILIGILNDLFEAMQAGKTNEALGNIINKLVTYTKTHFKDEERAMQACNYPELEAQKKQHAGFVEKVEQFQRDFAANKLTLSFDVTMFLKEWLLNHISGSDKKYGPYLNKSIVK